MLGKASRSGGICIVLLRKARGLCGVLHGGAKRRANCKCGARSVSALAVDCGLGCAAPGPAKAPVRIGGGAPPEAMCAIARIIAAFRPVPPPPPSARDAKCTGFCPSCVSRLNHAAGPAAHRE